MAATINGLAPTAQQKADFKEAFGVVDGGGNSVTPVPNVIPFGDSRTADCNYVDGTNEYTTNMSWLDYGLALVPGGAPLNVIRNAGISGNTTAQMLSRVAKDVIAYKPSVTTNWAGTNDTWASYADVEASAARMAMILDRQRAAGIFCIVISETTCSTKGTVFPKYVDYYNSLLCGYVEANTNCEFWDFNSIISDGTLANGFPKASLLRDGLHLSPLGASIVGKYVATKLSRFVQRLARLPVSQIDTIAVSPSSTNFSSNPFMLGSVAATGSGQSGTWPAGGSSTGHTAVASLVARADGRGNDWHQVITAAGAGSHFATLAGDASKFVPGLAYTIEASLKITSAVNISAVSITLDVTVDGVFYRRGWGYPTQAQIPGDSIADVELWIRSRVFSIPAGTVTGMVATLRVGFAGAGSGVIDWGLLASRRKVI